jgi:threonine synthase
MIGFVCHSCKRPYPPASTMYICQTCGGYFDLVFEETGRGEPLSYYLSIERLIRATGLPESAEFVSLGEGHTPIIQAPLFGRNVYFKLEFQNPTASYKDRGSAALATFLKSQGISFVIEDSSGNAGASFAAYAARAGIAARIYIPEASGGPKRRQIEAYGADTITVPGPRSNAAEMVKEEAHKGIVYASHAHQPHVLVGYLSLAFEIVDQIGSAPGCVIVPAGQGNLLFALGKGFHFMKRAGMIAEIPALIGVQAMACAPLWAVSKYGGAGLSLIVEQPTLAEGVKIKAPVRGDAILQLVKASGGEFLVVEEKAIGQGRDELARLGFYLEPTSALIWDAIYQIGDRYRDPIVAILTGSGIKVDF